MIAKKESTSNKKYRNIRNNNYNMNERKNLSIEIIMEI